MEKGLDEKGEDSYHVIITNFQGIGWVAERLKAPVLKTGKGESSSWVRIPPHPPFGNTILVFELKEQIIKTVLYIFYL